ncbi:MAG: MFS transporter [Nitrospinota bacterium]|nr:MFS transporter [Nitrospinota bacterium]
MNLNAENQQSKIWYGWIVLSVVYLVMLSLIGTRSSFGFFFKQISNEFSWSRAETAGAFSIGMFAQSVFSLFSGWISDRLSIRLTMSIGIAIFGLSVLLGSQIDSLAFFYLTYFLMNIGFASSTWVAQVPTLSNWFISKRGLALGISSSAQGTAFILNFFTPILIISLGWRMSYIFFGVLILFITLPCAAIFHRDKPEQKNTIADEPFLKSENPSLENEKKIYKKISDNHERFFSFHFFLFLTLFLPIAYVFTVLLVHFPAHMTDQGITESSSAGIFAIWGAFLIVGYLISSISDYYGRTPTFLTGSLLGSVSMFLIGKYESSFPVWFIYILTTLIGIALGLMRSTASAIMADHFSGKEFGKTNGIAMCLFSIFGGFGAWFTGFLYDSHSNYFLGFSIAAITLLISGISSIFLSLRESNQ